MKRVLYSMIAAFALLIIANVANAQSATAPLKLGAFDAESVVRLMPGYARVDSLLNIYSHDSLQTEQNAYYEEYQRLDSTFKKDSASNKPKAILQNLASQRQQVAMTLAYWQQYSQQRTQAKYGELAEPLYTKIRASFDKIRRANKVTVVLSPEAITFAEPSAVVNLTLLVAKDLGIKVPSGAEAQQ